MKTSNKIILSIYTLLVVGLAAISVGCGTPGSVAVGGNTTNITANASVDVNPNLSVGVTGSVDPTNPSNWSAGIVVTFKAPPTAATADLLAVVAAKSRSQLVYVIAKPDVRNADVQAAILAAVKEGASITPL